MKWKKIVESKDLIVFEKAFKSHKVRVEARFEDEAWRVFESIIKDKHSSLINEYTLSSKDEITKLLKSIKKNSNLKEFYTSLHPKRVVINLIRAYKDEFIEKWLFYINSENVENFLIVKYDSESKADLIVHERYKTLEEKLVDAIETKLGLKSISETTTFSIYYFKDSTVVKKQDPSFVSFEVDWEEE